MCPVPAFFSVTLGIQNPSFQQQLLAQQVLQWYCQEHGTRGKPLLLPEVNGTESDEHPSEHRGLLPQHDGPIIIKPSVGRDRCCECCREGEGGIHASHINMRQISTRTQPCTGIPAPTWSQGYIHTHTHTNASVQPFHEMHKHTAPRSFT